MSRRATILTALLALTPAPAAAATVEVSPAGADAAGCGAAATPCRTLGFALATRVGDGPDTVVLTAGTHATPGLVVSNPQAAGDTISGPGAVLAHDDGGGDALLRATVPLVFDGVTLRLPAAVASTRRALNLPAGSALTAVTVDVANASTAPAQVALSGGVTLDRVRVAGDHHGDAVDLDAPQGAVVRDSDLQAGSDATAAALLVAGGDVRVERGHLARTGAPDGSVVLDARDARVVVQDALLTGARTALRATAAPGHTASLTVAGSTVDAGAPGAADAGAASVMVAAPQAGAADAVAHVTRSLLLEAPGATQADGTVATVDCTDSVLPLTVTPLVACGAPNVALPTGPLFVDPAAGDYRLRPGVPTPGAAPAPLVLDHVALSRTRIRARGRGTRLRLRVSAPATVRMTLARLRGRRAVPLARWTFTVGPGETARTISGRLHGRPLRPGRYRLTLVARDASGHAAPTRRLTLRITP